MTTQPDALPACPSCGHISIGIETYVTDGFYAFCRSCHACGPYVSKEKAIAAFTNPAHALAASRAEVERLREALEGIAKKSNFQRDGSSFDNGMQAGFDVCASMAMAALAAQGGGTRATSTEPHRALVKLDEANKTD